MNVVRLRPADNEVLAAVAEAARLLRHGRDDVPVSLLHRRARMHVVGAIREAFPKLSVREVGRLLGLSESEIDRVGQDFYAARRTAWWEDDIVTEVVGVFMADFYGERAR